MQLSEQADPERRADWWLPSVAEKGMERLPSAQGFLLGCWNTDITCGGDNSKHSSAFSNGQHVNFYRHGFCYNKLKLLLTEKVFQSCLHCHTNACCSHNTCEYGRNCQSRSGLFWLTFVYRRAAKVLSPNGLAFCGNYRNNSQKLCLQRRETRCTGQTRQRCWRNSRAHTLDPYISADDS